MVEVSPQSPSPEWTSATSAGPHNSFLVPSPTSLLFSAYWTLKNATMISCNRIEILSLGFIEHGQPIRSSPSKPVIMLSCNKKHSNDSGVESQAIMSKHKTKCNSCGCRNKGKGLLTFRRPQLGKDLQRDILTLLPTFKWGLGGHGSWLYSF